VTQRPSLLTTLLSLLGPVVLLSVAVQQSRLAVAVSVAAVLLPASQQLSASAENSATHVDVQTV